MERSEEQLIEEKLKAELDEAAPDILDDLMAEIDKRDSAVSTVNTEKTTVHSSTVRTWKWLKTAGALAAALLIFAGAGALFGRSREADKLHDPVAMIGLDVNPSVEIYIDDTDHVTECKAVNEDGQKIIGGMDMKGADVRVAANALVGSMLTHGYLTDMNNSIFLSVVADDSAKGKALEIDLTEELNSYFENATVSAAVLGQYIEDDDEIEKFAEDNSISTGKAWLIKSLVAGSSRMTEESLLRLTTQELLLLWSEKDFAQNENTVKYGKVNSSGYITEKKACDIALKAVGLKRDAVQGLVAEYECENGRLIYEVEFIYGGAEYEYDVDAKDGSIVGNEIESSGNGQSENDDYDDDDAEEDDDEEDDDGNDDKEDGDGDDD